MAREAQRHLVPLAGVCLAREVSVEHVHALVKAGVLGAPEVGPEGFTVVPSMYLDAIDEDPKPALLDGEWRMSAAQGEYPSAVRGLTIPKVASTPAVEDLVRPNSP